MHAPANTTSNRNLGPSLLVIQFYRARSCEIAWATAVGLDLLGMLTAPLCFVLRHWQCLMVTDISFETREICDQVIAEFNNYKIKSDINGPIVMNIRYADTPAQKELKRVTAERRQFRTNEYNLGAYGTPHVGLTAHAYGLPSYRKPYPASTQ